MFKQARAAGTFGGILSFSDMTGLFPDLEPVCFIAEEVPREVSYVIDHRESVRLFCLQYIYIQLHCI